MPNLVGIGLSQVPTNSMLGGMAYQDPEHASIKNLDLKNLSQINSEIANTAVDVFVYDTSKDSDGGAWRKRTQNTSWYNETLGTSDRGTRREFPAVAVLVLSAHKLTIYDGDDPDLPMWMEVYQYVSGGNTGTTTNWHGGSGSLSVVAAINGIIICGTTGTRNLHFVNDRFSLFYSPASGNYTQLGGISNRNVAYSSWSASDEYYAQLVNSGVKDVAMTVLPNAPIDSATGLPVPTIAVATAGGVSVIKDDGTVVDITSGTIIHHEPRSVDFFGSRLFWTEGNNYDLQDRAFLNASIPSADIVLSHNGALPSGYIGYGLGGGASNIYTNYAFNLPLNNEPATRERKFQIGGPDNNIFLGCKHAVNGGIEHIHQNIESPSDGMVVTTTSSYNTGWMHGDCKGVFLSDTDIEDGVELVSNGTFNANTTGWTVVGGGSATGSSGQAQLTNNGTNNSSLDQTITTVVGKTYEVRANITPQGSGPMPRLYAAGKYAQVASNSNSSQLVSFAYTATSTSTTISVNANTNVNNAVTLADNISVKLTNDVTSSNLISGATYTASDRITSYSYTNGSSTLVITDNPASADGYVNLTLGGLTASTTYVLIVTANQTYTPTSGYNCHVGTTADGTVYFEDNFTGTASQNITFKTASSGNPTLVLYSNYNGALTYTLDLRLAEFDRSVGSLSAWNSGQNATIGQKDGLQVVGTVTKSPVATGAELVGYSGFTASNYLRYDASNMNFGTGDFSVSVWCVPSTDTSNEFILELDDASSSSNNRFYFLTTNTSTKRLYLPWDSDIAGSELSPGQWNHIVVGRKSGYGFVYVNSRWIADGYKAYTMDLEGNGFGTISNYSAGPSNDYAWSGSLALLRISGSAPSPEQIKKIYEDEKCLFHENAKVTLYGSSDAVTALAYDDTTNLLHVGTSAGRSEFQGLRRINNTTDAVTTAISASNGLVAEQ